MRKGIRLIKSCIAIVLAMLLSINSFAAIVSDNDGSAFITKAEFDSLKNDFQSQIDQYNTSIDSKIDGAIAAYLAGIRIETKASINPYVPNYNLMRWQPNLKAYGSEKHWTSATAKTTKTNQWFEPRINEKRWNLRGDVINICDNFDLGLGSVGSFFSWSASTSSSDWTNGIMSGRNAYVGSDDRSQSPPVLCFSLENDGDGSWYVRKADPFLNVFTAANAIISNPHEVSKIGSGPERYQYCYNGLYLKDTNFLDVLTTSGNEILKYNLGVKYQESTPDDSTTYAGTLQSAMNITNTNYPAAFTIRSAWIDAGYTKTESLLYTDMDPPSHYGIDGALLRGVTFTYLNDSYKTNMENLIYYMALGTDYDLDMNIAKITADIPSGVVFDLTGSSSTAAQIKGRISQVGLSNARLGAIGASKKTGTSIASTLSFPHWPTGKLRQQSANLFKYNKNPLKIGQGLPLLIESQVNGYVQVSFNYTVKYGLDDSTKANSIKLDICGEDFLNTTHTYFNGYEGLVDPSSTTKTLKQLKTLSNTTGKVELTIPIKKDQSLWFRMTPTVETGGYYASMSNLKIESYSE